MTKINEKSVIWLTGASSGIGEALTYELNTFNAKMIISARRLEELERVKSNCKYPENVEILKVDLSDNKNLVKDSEKAIKLFGHIDILINNGGVSQREKAILTDLEVDRKLMEVNYFGAISLSKAILPHQIERGSGHHLIISSAVGIVSTPFRSSYAASKHALHGFYDALRAEHHSDGIKVTIACPGFIHTNISINALKGDGSKQNTMDEGQANGMSAETCAKKIVDAMIKEKEEIYIGGFREVAGIYIKRYFPKLFSRIIRKAVTT